MAGTFLLSVLLLTVAICCFAQDDPDRKKDPKDYFFYVRQDTNGVGFVGNMVGNSGRVAYENPAVNFTFSWPLVEMTTDRVHNKVYVVTYPDSYPGPVLYKFNDHLRLDHAWTNVDYSFFDLQYAAKQSTLYGIKVTSTYGRVLSNFSLDEEADTVTATELFTLPYMWYVNASSYDGERDTYFGLINYFPGHPESTLDQQLVVADFSVPATEQQPVNAQVVKLDNTYGILQFVEYSHKLRTLTFASMTKPFQSDNEIVFGLLDAQTGKATHILYQAKGHAIGPLIIQDANDRALLFIQHSIGGIWEMIGIPLSRHDSVRNIASFSGDAYKNFAAAAHGFVVF